ncbi:hypothetical protein quinque_013309 [Culex quinquefasciatus]
MLLNLTLAAIVRGLDFAEADKIKEHTEIILSMVKNDCEALLLQESTSSANWCKLRGARSTRKSGPYRWNSRQNSETDYLTTAVALLEMGKVFVFGRILAADGLHEDK